MKTVALPSAFYLHHTTEFSAVDAKDRILKLSCAGGGQHFFAIPQKTKSNLGVGQSLGLHRGSDSAAFYRVRLHKFHTGGGVIKQIPDDDGSTLGTAGFRFFRNITGFQRKGSAAQSPCRLGHQIDPADGCDGRKSFTPEAHSGNGR